MKNSEVLIKSKLLEQISTGWDKYALVQWLCQNRDCMATVMVHEKCGENYEPEKCPVCGGERLEWNSVYAADVDGNVTE
jgi:aromatic ring-cleaving dioxygenase